MPSKLETRLRAWEPAHYNVDLRDGTHVWLRPAIAKLDGQGRELAAVDVTLSADDVPKAWSSIIDAEDCRALARIFGQLAAELDALAKPTPPPRARVSRAR